MSAEPGVCKVVAERVDLPPMAADTSFEWDGIGTVPLSIGPRMGTGWHPERSLTPGDRCLVPSSPPQALDWEREAQRLTVYLDSGILQATVCDVVPGATGELLWARRERYAPLITLYVHPVLVVHAASESSKGDRVEVVPHLRAGDPLLHHITLVLQAEIDAEGLAGRLYAETLTNALAVHFLRRYGTCRPAAGAWTGGLSKPKLRRTTEYIEAHLPHELSLTEIAAVAQTSPAHFARLFRQATGRTPHQYLIMRRIERAKRLLTESALPIIDIGHQVGFTDQSYFTAVFRKHVAATPKTYRGETQR
jgi:AraC-like DNA-binding protein